MDADYARNQGGASAGFRHALFVLATVMSAPRPRLAVLDAGLKALSTDSGMPLVQGYDARYTGASDEHGKLEGDVPRHGEKIRLVPGHCDPTVDRYDWYVGVRGGRIECLWPIAARGALS
jgi:D-serine deaminase-like pyridoxal phosphate-dependent protein